MGLPTTVLSLLPLRESVNSHELCHGRKFRGKWESLSAESFAIPLTVCTALVLATKNHLAANGDNSRCYQDSCECFQMDSDVPVCTMGQVTEPVSDGALFPLIRLSSGVSFLYITRKM